MNAYKLNGIIGLIAKHAIIKSLNIVPTDLYKTIKDISGRGVIELKDGRRFELELKYLGNG
jgi:hypothetical protein